MTLELEIVRQGERRQALPPHTAFQTSTLEALAGGRWDGELTVGELLEHGTFGIGTFNALDGELIVLDGKAWRACADGTVVPAPATMRTPYATVLNFASDLALAVPEPMSGPQFVEVLASTAHEMGAPFAVRFDGRLDDIMARSVPHQSRPYGTLDDIADREQRTFTFERTLGTLVGFSFPPTAASLQTPGAHLHVITADRERGGHLFEATVGPGVLRICTLRGLRLDLPEDVAPPSVVLPDPLAAAVQRLERRWAPPQMRDQKRDAHVLPSRHGLRHPRRRRTRGDQPSRPRPA
jgi:acetolactate decarboxylase